MASPTLRSALEHDAWQLRSGRPPKRRAAEDARFHEKSKTGRKIRGRLLFLVAAVGQRTFAGRELVELQYSRFRWRW